MEKTQTISLHRNMLAIIIIREMEDSRKQIKRGALLGYLAIAINIIAGLLYTPWMISEIGQSDYGLYTLALSVISLFLFDFGMSAAVSRFIAREQVAGNTDNVNNLLGSFYKIYIAIDIVIFLVLAIVFNFIDSIYTGLTPQEIERLKIVYLIVGVFSVLTFPTIPFSGILQAYERFVALRLCDIFNKLFSIICVVCALCLGGGLYELVLINAASSLLTAWIKYIIIRHRTGVRASLSYWNWKTIKEIVGFSAWTTVNGLCQRCIFNITPSVLGIVANSASVAVFGIASTIEGYVFHIANAMNGLFIARVANISVNHEAESREKLLELMIKVGRIQFTITGAIVALFASVGHDFILLWIGPNYEDAYLGGLLIIIPSLISSSQQIATTTVSIENKVKYQSYVYIIMAVVNVCLSVPLSSLCGALGACISIFIAYMLCNVLMNVLYYKVLRIDVFSFYKFCYTKLLIPIGATILVGFALNAVFPDYSWLWFFAKSLVLVLVYIVSLAPLTNEYERGLIRSLRCKLAR